MTNQEQFMDDELERAADTAADTADGGAERGADSRIEIERLREDYPVRRSLLEEALVTDLMITPVDARKRIEDMARQIVEGASRGALRATFGDLSRANDSVQAALEKILRTNQYRDMVEDPKKFRNLLYRAAFNQAITDHRREPKSSSLDDENVESDKWVNTGSPGLTVNNIVGPSHPDQILETLMMGIQATLPGTTANLIFGLVEETFSARKNEDGTKRPARSAAERKAIERARKRFADEYGISAEEIESAKLITIWGRLAGIRRNKSVATFIIRCARNEILPPEDTTRPAIPVWLESLPADEQIEKLAAAAQSGQRKAIAMKTLGSSDDDNR